VRSIAEDRIEKGGHGPCFRFWFFGLSFGMQGASLSFGIGKALAKLQV
jgi:hypothetical protein